MYYRIYINNLERSLIYFSVQIYAIVIVNLKVLTKIKL